MGEGGSAQSCSTGRKKKNEEIATAFFKNFCLMCNVRKYIAFLHNPTSIKKHFASKLWAGSGGHFVEEWKVSSRNPEFFLFLKWEDEGARAQFHQGEK